MNGEDQIGNKAKNLIFLKSKGFKVPNLFVISGNDILNLVSNFDINIKNLIKKIELEFSYSSYSIRSSSLFEDLDESSMAGQFLSFINVSKDEITFSIKQMLEHVKINKLGVNKFSIIIQEYIPTDISGVTFSRDPLGFNKMLVEFYYGEGEELVSGKIIPKQIHLNGNEKYLEVFGSNTQHIIETFRKIEKEFQAPMDIEWCIYNSQLFLLQSRKITNINQKKYNSVLYFEKMISDSENYYFEKNEISEIFPKIDTFSSSLLEELYKKGGPINLFYSKNKIDLYYTNYFKVIGNEIFVDKEKELKSFFPSFTYFKRDYIKIGFDSLSGFFKSIKNFIFLNLIKIKGKEIEKDLIKLIEKKEYGDLKCIFNEFLNNYQFIYQANYYTGKIFSKLENALRNQDFTFTEAMNLNIDIKKDSLKFNYDGLIGNSLNILDDTKFRIFIQNATCEGNNNKWENFPIWKRNFLLPYIKDAKYMQYVRELGRILTVKYINLIRNECIKISDKFGLHDKNDIYFYSIGEILSQNIDKKVLKSRKEEFIKNNYFEFPYSISSKELFTKKGNTGISFGLGKGIIVEEFNLKNIEDDKILFVEVISPHLIKYFDDINGIISLSGGILSHLSILAREAGVPVIVIDEKINISNLIGKQVEINGNNGDIIIKDTN